MSYHEERAMRLLLQIRDEGVHSKNKQLSAQLKAANAKIERLEKQLNIAREAITWIQDQCGYASPVWIKMNDCLKAINRDKE